MRVTAATAHTQHRFVERRRPTEQAGEEYHVCALTDDRVVHVIVSLRPDGSVAEATETFLRDQILRVVPGGDRAAIEVEDAAVRPWIALPLELAMTLVGTAASRRAPGRNCSYFA